MRGSEDWRGAEVCCLLLKGPATTTTLFPQTVLCLPELLKKQQVFDTTAGSYLKLYHSCICILLRTSSLLSCVMCTIVISITAVNYFKKQHLPGSSQISAGSFNPWGELWTNLTICVCRGTNNEAIKAKREIPSFLKSMWNCDCASKSCWPPYVNVTPNINDRCFQIFI